MRFVIVTGMSGSGKRTAMKMLEDIGFYCVDNLPVGLVDKFAELASLPGSELTKVALGLDARSVGAIEQLPVMLDKLNSSGYQVEVIFLEASDQTIIKRYKETRRVHPMAADGRIEDGVTKEREALSDIRGRATYVFDTSTLLTRELKEKLDEIFASGDNFGNFRINVLSFGYKHGIPADADLVFDVRFLPNPYYIDELRTKTGLDQEVRDYVMSFEDAGIFLDKLEDMLTFLIPKYIQEGKYNLVIGIGCTGGKHRSVTLAKGIYDRLKALENVNVRLIHRDVKAQGK
ncbi:MAG: RNase adapter RapZ [Lachnospiraceae bacterium]|nr:RNase adapter RapZ [Lachnospiraceae bacterium]